MNYGILRDKGKGASKTDEACSAAGCAKAATGEAYSMGGSLGVFCDIHGARLVDSGEADASLGLSQ